MPRDVLAQLLRNLSVININLDARPTFRELHEHRIVNIAVNDNYPFICLPDQSGNKGVCVKNLPVKEDSFLDHIILI